MRPTFIPNYVNTDLYDILLEEVPWVRVNQTPRRECFMSVDLSLSYSYGNSNSDRTRVYKAVAMHPAVKALMDRLNAEFGCAYNVCVLNAYADHREHLGWHADDSPEQDLDHPITVVAFGATRELWIKDMGATGKVPPEDRFAMTPGSLFIMPGGFQGKMKHKIPKCDRPCGGRISLTFRRLLRNPD